MQNLKVSLVQSSLFWEQPEANRAHFEEMIWSMEEKTDLVILPETFTTGFSIRPDKLAEVKHTHTYRWMQQMAKQTGAVVMGSYIVNDGGRFFNRLYAVYPDGADISYDKKHLFSLANETGPFTPGDQKTIFEVKGWRVSPMICYDLRFPVWARSKSTNGRMYEYDLLVYVANWPAPRIHAWDTLLQARAIENLSFSIGVNRLGQDENGLEYPGHSAAYDCKGELVGKVSGEKVETFELNRSLLDKFRARFPFQQDADSFSIQ